MPSALGGLKVLDFSRVLAGPLATMVLGDLGAEVTKVESPAGDDTRQWGPPYDEAGDATYFQAVNRNKESLVLDLADPADLARAVLLAGEADVVVENFRPGVTERFGLDYESLQETNRGLIYCSITGFGAGKGAALPGYDLLVQALGGLMSITGPPTANRRRSGSRWWTCWPVCSRRSGSWPHSNTGGSPARASWSRSTCSPRCSLDS